MKLPTILLAAASLASVASLANAAKVVLDDFNDPYKGQTTLGWRLGATAEAGY